MEKTGYLNLASTAEIREGVEMAIVRDKLALWNWKQFSFTAVIRFLPLALSLFVVSIAGQSLAAVGSPAEITGVQQCLKRLGYYSGPVTGNYGPLTQNAVSRFQKRNGLPSHGTLGPRTQNLLRSQCNPTASRRVTRVRVVTTTTTTNGGVLTLNSRGAAVSNLQRNLSALGFFRGPVTGVFGPQTQQAVIAFQRNYGIPTDGIAGARTLNQVRIALNPDRGGGFGGPDINPDALNEGDRGDSVRQLQDNLRTLGFFSTNSTGIFGPATRNAVINFQRSQGIFATGVADSQTLARVSQLILVSNPDNDGCSSERSEICLGERGQRVIVLQQRLQQWGVLRGNIDGFYGPTTRDAVQQFQRYSGLPTTGYVDFRTWQALGFTNANIPPNISNPVNDNRYVVVIPVFANDTINRVRQYLPQAFIASSRLGNYVNAGAFRERNDAQKLTKELRDRGFDARVEYFN